MFRHWREWAIYQDSRAAGGRTIFDQRTTAPARDEVAVQVFYASRRKRWRGALMVAAALAAGVFLVWRQPPLNMFDYFDMALVATTWIGLIWVSAMGIERCFEPMPTLLARPEGLVLFPTTDPDAIIPWDQITRIETFRFANTRLAPRFLTIVVDDHRSISRHLPWHLKIAYRMDRWAAGDNRYFRPGSDFDVPITQVVADCEAWRIAHSATSVATDGSE